MLMCELKDNEIERIIVCELCEDNEAHGKCYSCDSFFCRDCMHNVNGFKICIDCEESTKGEK